MSRPTGFADLLGKRVGLYGFGVEGRATARRLRDVAADLIIVDDEPRDEGVIATARGGLDALSTCDVVIKSPGIPRRRGDVVALEDRGIVITSALDLWLHETDVQRVIAVTGTKGKSTTTSLIAFLLRTLGEEAHELGNFGQPPYDPDLETSSGWLVLEVSSFQSLDMTRAPGLVVVTSLGSDHLDWHGSLEQYHEDKLTITRAPGEHVTLIAEHPALLAARPSMGGQVVVAAPDATGLAGDLGLLGAHNDSNWDAHNDLVANHTKHAGHTDRPIAGLIRDLKRRGMLDETLIVWGGEFGRQPTAEYAEGTGRDHNSFGFTMWLAGGGIKGGTSVGQTDEIGSAAVEDRLHVKRLHATILNQLGLDPNGLSYFYGGLHQKLVGVEGAEPIRQII